MLNVLICHPIFCINYMEILDQKPTFQQWLKNNPRGSINDYYREYGASPIAPSEPQPYIVPSVAPEPPRASSVMAFIITPMKALFIGLIFLAGVMVFTNPDDAKHRDAVKREIAKAMGLDETLGAVSKPMGFEALGSFAGGAIALQFADVMVNSMVTVDNYVLFSLTKVTYEGVTKPIGVGLFGNVYISGDVKDKLNELRAK